MKKFAQGIIILVLAAVAVFAGVNSVSADECDGQYDSSCATDKMWVDLKVKNPETGQYVDNLGMTDHKFVPGEEVMFSMRISNNDPDTIGKVFVTNWLPDEVEYVKGPDINHYDSNTHEEVFEFSNLEGRGTRTYYLTTRVKPEEESLMGKALKCTYDEFAARTEAGEEDKDSAQFCIAKGELVASQKGGFVTTLPETGPMEWALAMGSTVGLAGLGIGFIKKGKKGLSK